MQNYGNLGVDLRPKLIRAGSSGAITDYNNIMEAEQALAEIPMKHKRI